MPGDAPIEHDVRWPVVSLVDIATKIGSGATPKGGADAYLASRSRFALVRSQNIFDRRFDNDGLAFITDEQAAGLRGVVLQPDDILLNITGDGVTFGRACIVPKEVLPACVNQHVSIIRLDSQRAHAGYVLAFLTHPDVKSYIESFNAGGSRRAVTKGHIESFRLPLPPLPEQRAIAHILGTLDDKIELNRRMNETLEAMARALFKSWFVDFDPVHAKAEGRDPGLPQPLADLFPDSFEDSELGEIPKGWEVGRFGEVIVQLRDQENPLSSPEALYHHFSLPAFDEGQSPKAEYGESIKSQKSRVPAGVVLLSKLNPEIERVWLVDVRPTERAVCSTEFLVLRAQSPFTRSFVYCLARSPLFRQQIEGLVTGTSKSHQRAQVESILNLAVVVPPSSIVTAFDHSTDSLLARTLECRRESRTLADLRDTLLPKLISGELRVADAQRFAERAFASASS
jgi:type I restriction enzyme S subunit